jgi:hypothetical protein
MIEAPRHLIRRPAHFVRVLRLFADGPRLTFLSYKAFRGPGLCQKCGCTDRYGCSPRCHWANKDATLCSACVERKTR